MDATIKLNPVRPPFHKCREVAEEDLIQIIEPGNDNEKWCEVHRGAQNIYNRRKEEVEEEIAQKRKREQEEIWNDCQRRKFEQEAIMEGCQQVSQECATNVGVNTTSNHSKKNDLHVKQRKGKELRTLELVQKKSSLVQLTGSKKFLLVVGMSPISLEWLKDIDPDSKEPSSDIVQYLFDYDRQVKKEHCLLPCTSNYFTVKMFDFEARATAMVKLLRDRDDVHEVFSVSENLKNDKKFDDCYKNSNILSGGRSTKDILNKLRELKKILVKKGAVFVKRF